VLQYVLIRSYTLGVHTKVRDSLSSAHDVREMCAARARAAHIILHSASYIMDPSKRTWIVTIPWLDALPPTDDNIPLLTAHNVRAKYSIANESLTIIYRFKNTRLASYISRAFTHDFVVIAAASPDKVILFDCADSDWTFKYVQPVDIVDDELPLPGSVQDKHPIGDAVGFFCVTTERATVKRLRAQITELDQQLGAIGKRFRRDCVDLLEL